ncbi:hypothetical protein Q31b_52040 [Novipirellula aureliae]|uniref:Translational regulator CsrA n=1 Tax=Novipirellula aureliae TaxID=2527966 RepID=A0A5C6DLH8_9BACT|nr:carbon storage regulator [Novipirellula aureliae]TWU35769.1 hypothetical protein Q31b_52040 [Novipirellula aureliae]
MLVLSRKIGERITIGDDVQITITRIAGGRVTIGIDAPKSVTVRRNELAIQNHESSPRFSGTLGLPGQRRAPLIEDVSNV